MYKILNIPKYNKLHCLKSITNLQFKIPFNIYIYILGLEYESYSQF